MITLTYYRHGQEYTEDFTEDQARQELERAGLKNVDKLTEAEVYELLREITE